MTNSTWNDCRFVPGTPAGHYESYFQRANHSQRPLAFWIRYTIFSPQGRPDDAVGELWAIYFDGERERIAVAKEVRPISDCHIGMRGLDIRIGEAVLAEGYLSGQAASSVHCLEWILAFSGGQRPLLLLSEALYRTRLPHAKALVGTPNAIFEGVLTVDGAEVSIDGWRGSQNHNPKSGSYPLNMGILFEGELMEASIIFAVT